MKPMVEFLKALVPVIIASPGMPLSRAMDELLAKTGGVSRAEAKTWFNEIVRFYDSIGATKGGTFTDWRNSIVRKGEVTAQALFDATGQALLEIPAMADVNQALRQKDQEDRFVQAEIDIAFLEGFQRNQSDTRIIKALGHGLQALSHYRDGLKQRIGN